MNDPEFTMGEIARTMQRMDSRLERVIEDHEKRLRRIEKWTYLVPPTFLTASAGVIIALVNAR